MKKTSRAPLPLYLLLAALLFSAGLNCYLLLTVENDSLPGTFFDDPRVVESELDLRLAQAQLAQCQAEQLRKDSLLITLLPKSRAVPTGL